MMELKKELHFLKNDLKEKDEEINKQKKYLKCMKIQDLEVFFLIFY